MTGAGVVREGTNVSDNFSRLHFPWQWCPDGQELGPHIGQSYVLWFLWQTAGQ